MIITTKSASALLTPKIPRSKSMKKKMKTGGRRSASKKSKKSGGRRR